MRCSYRCVPFHLLFAGKYGSSSLSAYSDGSSGIQGSDTTGGGDGGGGEGFERENSLGELSRDGYGGGDGDRESEGTTGSSYRASSSVGDGLDGDLDLLEDGDSPGGKGVGSPAGGARQPLLAQDRRASESRAARADRGGSSPATVASGRRGGLVGAISSLFSFSGGAGRGRGRRNYDQLKNPLLGVEVGFSEAQELAQEVDNITYEGTVKLLNFAYLSLDKQGRKLLGSGSFSKVYAGRYRSHPVAVKMLFTQDLNPDVIKRCSNEARILTEIAPHPNVVRVFGVAVLPPRYSRRLYSICGPLPFLSRAVALSYQRVPGAGDLRVWLAERRAARRRGQQRRREPAPAEPVLLGPHVPRAGLRQGPASTARLLAHALPQRHQEHELPQ